ncbi:MULTISPECIES: universal stress protein [Kitasatospora]|uniref:Universal stress protein n=1 Tax=Kitasatospora cystarginea TaxID=58350 RepID=A0ABP5QTX7_9ACTN
MNGSTAPTGTGSRRPVVVGVSRSEASRWAVRWACDAAAWRGLPLHLLHAQDWPTGISPQTEPGRPGHHRLITLRAHGEELLETARLLAAERHPELEITSRLVEGRPVRVLREAAEEAAQLVLGGRHLTEPQATLMIASKGASLVGHPPCPVVLVPEPEPDTSGAGPVVVGIDGSAACEAAIGFAFEEASLGQTDLQAVEVRRPREADRPDLVEESLLDLSESLAGWREKYPDVRVRHEVLTGDPAQMLATAARHARCLVIGNRGLGGFQGLVLGSTGRVLVNRCHRPLVVVPSGSRSR